MRAARRTLASALALGLVLAGCGLDPSPAPTASGPAPASAAATAQASLATPSPTEPLNGGSDPLPGTAADPGLIAAVLGANQPGLTFQYDSDTTGRVATDRGVRKDFAALAIGLYTVTAQSPVEDYAVVTVLRLRDPAAADDAWFRAYRDSYDESACAQAGGVLRHAQTEMETHTVFIGSCAGGAYTYHLRTKTDDLVISITGVGPGRLGERLAAAVADP